VSEIEQAIAKKKARIWNRLVALMAEENFRLVSRPMVDVELLPEPPGPAADPESTTTTETET